MRRIRLYPSKKEVLDSLLSESPHLKSFEKLVLVIEHKKVSSSLGIIKGELFQNRKVILKGCMTCVPERVEESFNWDMLSQGQSYFEGYSVDYQGETIGSLIKQGLKKSIKEGKIPFFQK